MNKQMLELLVQSGLLINVSEYRVKELDPNIKKFAELIVKECVGIVAKRKDQAIDDSWNVDEAMSMVEMDLLEHFGVEE